MVLVPHWLRPIRANALTRIKQRQARPVLCGSDLVRPSAQVEVIRRVDHHSWRLLWTHSRSGCLIPHDILVTTGNDGAAEFRIVDDEHFCGVAIHEVSATAAATASTTT